MNKLVVKMLAAGSLLVSAQVAHAAAASGSIACEGGVNGYVKVNVEYSASVTDGTSVSLKIEENKKTIVDVSAEEGGASANLIHDAFVTSSEVDSDGHILHYGSGAAPTQLLTFAGAGNTRPVLVKVDLEKEVLTIDGVKLAIFCKK